MYVCMYVYIYIYIYIYIYMSCALCDVVCFDFVKICKIHHISKYPDEGLMYKNLK